MKNLRKKIDSQKGFTLIEMLVVIVVVAIGLVGALSFFNININNQNETKNELIAANLAQEGADLVRNLRDSRDLNGISWAELTGQAPYGLSANRLTKCSGIDFRSLAGSPRDCIVGGSPNICLSSGRYQQCPGGTDTGMQRTLSITLNADKSLTVKCDVTWNGRTTTAKDILYKNSF